MARYRKINGDYYARIRPKGKKEIAIPLHTNQLKQAIIRLKEVEVYEPLLIEGEDVEFSWQNGTTTVIKEVTIQDAVEQYIKYKISDNLQESTIQSYRLALNHFMDIIGSLKNIEIIDIADINLYKERCHNDYMPTTINIRLRGIKAFLNWCQENEFIKKAPKVKQLRGIVAEPIYLSNKEFKKICTHLTAFLKRVVYFYRETGCRLAEPFYSTIDGIWMTINSSSSKTHKSRDIELTPELKEILIEMKNKTHLPEEKNGKPICKTHCIAYYSKSFQDACKKAGIKGKKFHCLRHTFAVRKYLETKDIYGVAKALGHSNVTTTQIYTKFNSKKLAYHFPDLCSKSSNGK